MVEVNFAHDKKPGQNKKGGGIHDRPEFQRFQHHFAQLVCQGWNFLDSTSFIKSLNLEAKEVS
jgi:hypothetical protein